MKKFLLLLSLLLLLFNAIGALYGGWHLITHPDGSSILLPIEFLRGTMFTTYFIPGLILFCCNGLFDLIVCLAIFKRYKFYPELIMLAGIVLTGWLVIQILIIQILYFLQYILGAVGIGLILCGWLLRKLRAASLS